MADIKVFDITDGLYDSATAATISGATSGTIPVDGARFRHAALRVANGAGSTATVTLSAGTTGGVRSSLGSKTYSVPDGEVHYIPLWDTARFVNLPDADIDYLMAAAGTGTTTAVLMEVITTN